MELASKLIARLKLPGETISSEELACAAWPRAVGKKVAQHARPSKLVRTCLVVEVEDQVWQRQLFALRGFILRNLEKGLGSGLVDDLEFRVVPRRRDAQRAAQGTRGLADDEACGIEDPVLRSIYRAARKRALA